MNKYKTLIKLYRVISITLLAFLTFMYTEYKNKDCTITHEVVNPNYVFLGDSITESYDLEKYYKKLPTVNSGIMGHVTKDILNDLEDRVYKYNPSKVILLIGINDLLYENHDDQISKDIDEITGKIHKELPDCEIYIQSIYPMNNDWYVYASKEEITKVNNEIKKICKENNFKYLDVYSVLIDDNYQFDKKYTNDGLHPNEEGYKVITKYIKEEIVK